ncbi:ubiquitin E3 ligase ICP0 [Equid herpesvirus 6]|uniref:RING-type E3 ubiquitin transferase n=1 Tax=Equid herpesvirus 6 TaxID=173566 RepID=A0A7S9YUS0_9ALPH|nr:ubiquitin E3 ligase ICP0 [Equid herpesvirus 6]QPI70173.1 ubiquitin E3 ligase ICP0 [Equid herpesvirus 6]
MDPRDDPCAICLEPPEDVSAALPCLHRFCYACLTRWVDLNPRCPLCKTPVASLLHAIRSDREFKEIEVAGAPVAEYDGPPEDALTAAPSQDRGRAPAAGRPGPAAFVPLNANGTAGAPRLQPLVDWMSERLEALFETPDFALVMRNIVMDALCEYGCDEAELTRLLWPLIHDDTAAFVAGLLEEAGRCVSRPAAAPRPGETRGVEFIDSSSASSDGEESDSDDDSEVDTEDLTDPEDTEYDDSEPESTRAPGAPRRAGRGSWAAIHYPMLTRSRRREPPPARAANQDGATRERRQSRSDLCRRGHLGVIDLTLDSDTEDEPETGRRAAPALGAQAGSQQLGHPLSQRPPPRSAPPPPRLPRRARAAPPGGRDTGRRVRAEVCRTGPAAPPTTLGPAAAPASPAGPRGRGPRHSGGEFARRFAELAPRAPAPPEAMSPAIVAWVEGSRPQPAPAPRTTPPRAPRHRFKGTPRRWTEERAARLRGGVVRGARRRSATTPYPAARRPPPAAPARPAAPGPFLPNTREAPPAGAEGRSPPRGR